jgi:hypothetical protein
MNKYRIMIEGFFDVEALSEGHAMDKAIKMITRNECVGWIIKKDKEVD